MAADDPVFTLRYCDHVPLDLRRHQPTENDWPTFTLADEHRERQARPDLLEVVTRGGSKARVSDVLAQHTVLGVAS